MIDNYAKNYFNAINEALIKSTFSVKGQSVTVETMF